MATLVHIPRGFWLALVAGLCTVAVESIPHLRNKNFKDAIYSVPWDGALIYGAISMLVVGPNLIMANGSVDISQAAYIHAWIRHPSHFLPSTWSMVDNVPTVVFILLSATLIFIYRDHCFNSDDEISRFVSAYVVAIISIMIGGGYILTELWRVNYIIFLQPFHIDDFVYFILFGGIAKIGLPVIERIGEKYTAKPSTFSIVIVLSVVAIGTLGWTGTFVLATQTDAVEVSKYNDRVLLNNYIDRNSVDGELSESYAWLNSNTGKNETIIVNPNRDDIRDETDRSTIVTRDFVFTPKGMIEWKTRMDDVCDTDIKKYDKDSTKLMNVCSKNFNELSEEKIVEISSKYDAKYIMSTNSTYNLERKFANGEYYIYKINNSSSVNKANSVRISNIIQPVAPRRK